MKFALIASLLIALCFLSTPLAFAQTTSPTPTPVGSGEAETSTSGSGVLNAFISGFDWISSGLVFHTPSLLDDTIKLNDGTELSGLSKFRTIFYDIAIPLFVLIISAVAFSHITNDTPAQLRAFFKRLAFIVILFILTPSILSYSIQFVNLLNEKIIAENAFNLSTLVNDFLGNFMQNPGSGGLFNFSFRLPNLNTVLQLIILIISIGFLLIGFIYIIFQAIIRFIALILLSVIFPIVLPFALSQRTENIANTYFRTWFTFLIQQPAFVLGFAIVSTILTSIVHTHNASIGTLFIYSGSLIFLGGVNVFVGKIFGDGWSLVSTNAQSMIGSHSINKSFGEVKRGAITGNATGVRSYAGKYLRDKIGGFQNPIKERMQNQQEAGRKNSKTGKDNKGNDTSNGIKIKLMTTPQQSEGGTKTEARKQTRTEYYAQPTGAHVEEKDAKKSVSKNNQDGSSVGVKSEIQKKSPVANIVQANTVKPIIMKRPDDIKEKISPKRVLRMPQRKNKKV